MGRSPGEGKGYPLQYSGLENPTDCIAHGVAKSRTRLSDLHFPFSRGGLRDHRWTGLSTSSTAPFPQPCCPCPSPACHFNLQCARPALAPSLTASALSFHSPSLPTTWVTNPVICPMPLLPWSMSSSTARAGSLFYLFTAVPGAWLGVGDCMYLWCHGCCLAWGQDGLQLEDKGSRGTQDGRPC